MTQSIKRILIIAPKGVRYKPSILGSPKRQKVIIKRYFIGLAGCHRNQPGFL
jgi:hypothetical protein